MLMEHGTKDLLIKGLFKVQGHTKERITNMLDPGKMEKCKALVAVNGLMKLER